MPQYPSSLDVCSVSTGVPREEGPLGRHYWDNEMRTEVDRDPSLYIILSLNTHLEVDYSTVHLFDRQGEICNTRVRHEHTYRQPNDELVECLDWGGQAMNEYYQYGDFGEVTTTRAQERG